MAISRKKGIENYHLTEEEFRLLPYLDTRLYIETATNRFKGWTHSFDTSHPDWEFRVAIQNKLAEGLRRTIECEIAHYQQMSVVRVLYLGASLGSICTYLTLQCMKRLNLLHKVRISIYDLLREPLEKTQRGEFDMSEASAEALGVNKDFTVADYKRCLRDATVVVGSVVQLDALSKEFDISIAPYIHHHLNIYDKLAACQQMKMVTGTNGLIVIGDLTFDCQSFNRWLEKHAVETVPYAVESFISSDEHMQMLGGARPPLFSFSGDCYYTFIVRNE